MTGTRGSFTHFLVYTISSLAEQTTPAFLTLAEASSLFVVPGLSFMDYDLDEEQIGGSLYWFAPPVIGEIRTYQVYLGSVDEQNRSTNRILLVSLPYDQLTLEVPPDTEVNETSHILTRPQGPQSIALALSLSFSMLWQVSQAEV